MAVKTDEATKIVFMAQGFKNTALTSFDRTKMERHKACIAYPKPVNNEMFAKRNDKIALRAMYNKQHNSVEHLV